MLQAVPTPKPTQGQGGWSSQGLASPMSVERPPWPHQERDRDRPREDGRGMHACAVGDKRHGVETAKITMRRPFKEGKKLAAYQQRAE